MIFSQSIHIITRLASLPFFPDLPSDTVFLYNLRLMRESESGREVVRHTTVEGREQICGEGRL
jgi:hypothetical protein